MYLFESRIKINCTEKETLVVFSGQLEGGQLEYTQLIEKGFRSFQNRPEEVLFIYPEYIHSSILQLFTKNGSCFRNIIRYGKDTPVTLLAFNENGDFSEKSLHLTSSLTNNLNELRDKIVYKGVFNLAESRRNQVIQKAPSGTVFIKPSKQEYDEFIKASELAIGYAENQFIGFSLLTKQPKNRKIKRIYIDTNSISSFIEALLYYKMKFSNSTCKTAIYHSYSSYGGKDKARPEDSEDIWLIISASRSNGMGIKMAQEWNLKNDQVITLLSYTATEKNKTGDEILVNISPLSKSAEQDLIYDSLMKVKVWGENFTAEVEKPNPVHIKAKHKTPAISKLITPNNNSKLFKLNHRANANSPVHSIYIDCNNYFKSNKEHINWLNNIIDWYIPAKIGWIIYQENNEASYTLANLIEQRMSANGIKNFEKIDIDNAHKKVSSSDSIVIAIPTISTGQTLLKLNRNLRISGHTGNRIFISPFVVSPSKPSFEQFKNSLTYGPNGMKYLFFTWRTVYIGHTDPSNSWHHELDVVRYLDSTFWKGRARKLGNYQEGLNGAIGTPSTDINEHLEFTKDFAFWSPYNENKVDHEAVYLTISSILQGLREIPYSHKNKDSLFNYVYQHAVIAPDNFTRLTDALLQSCLWRAANIREMDYRSSAEISQEFAEIVERLIEENIEGVKNAAFDLLMGIATGKIQLDKEILNSLISKALDLYSEINNNAILLLNYISNKYQLKLHSNIEEEIPI